MIKNILIQTASTNGRGACTAFNKKTITSRFDIMQANITAKAISQPWRCLGKDTQTIPEAKKNLPNALCSEVLLAM